MAGLTTFNVQSLDANIAFYDRVLAAAGWSRFIRTASFCGYARDGDDSGDTVWVCGPTPGVAAASGRRQAGELALAA